MLQDLQDRREPPERLVLRVNKAPRDLREPQASLEVWEQLVLVGNLVNLEILGLRVILEKLVLREQLERMVH